MRVTQITNTSFRANSINIVAKDNMHVKDLYLQVMKATAVESPLRSGQVVYSISGRNPGIEILNPAAGLPDYLKKIGIKFTAQ